MTYVKIKIGTKEDGSKKILRIDKLIKEEMDKVKLRVDKKGWDYIALVSGIPGSGKSTLARGLARYLCSWFSLKYIAFNGDDFIRITEKCPPLSAVILDESFASLNSKVGMSSDFIKIINHLQIIRQKHLFIFLCLPNFFDLAKGVAIFRSSHLFVTYPTLDGDKGRFLVFDRDAKRKLYVKGSKFMDYNAEKANFKGLFHLNPDILDENEYEERKRRHTLNMTEQEINKNPEKSQRNTIIYKLYKNYGWKVVDLAELAGIHKRSIYRIIESAKKSAENS